MLKQNKIKIFTIKKKTLIFNENEMNNKAISNPKHHNPLFLRYFPSLPLSPNIESMAAVHCCLSVTSAAVPSSQDSPSPPPPISRPPTKIILPNKKPEKWSTGVAPGEYGGPPTTTKLRKYWGGEQDPLASDDYLWNKDFMDRMKKLIQDPEDVAKDSTFTSVKVWFWVFSVFLGSG